MYFDLEDYHPDISPVGQAISWREGVLLSIIAHLVMVILILVAPKWFPWLTEPRRVQVMARQAPQEPPLQYMMVAPRFERPVAKAPERALPSDLNRAAASPERAKKPENMEPLSRGNSPERVDQPPKQTARGQGPQPDPAAGNPVDKAQADQSQKIADSQSSLQLPSAQSRITNGANGRASSSGGSLGDALRNLQRYTQGEAFDNPGGGGGQFGPEIQFDTKGVEFGPWIRRFIAQVKRNWLIPYAAMSMKGHVAIQFNVHKDGSITDLQVVGASPVDAFNNAALGALSGSNPTQPLPPEYPDNKAFFTVTFFYNETPPR
ncbi:MAG TPA: TonB family protein [Vicinamibacterales bacterium]|jgi:TonB family protein|nr:TonB family protein [Vicinamibacterales bacterium]